MEQCEFFLLMALVQSAASPWVRKEVEWWIEHRSVEQLLIVVTDGEIAWSAGSTDFDWNSTSCLPDLLRGRFREEPHYVELRWARDRSDLSRRNSRFRNAALTLAAPLHGRPMDELDGEDLRQQRLLRITAGVAVVVIGVLTLISMVERRSVQEETRMAQSASLHHPTTKCQLLYSGHLSQLRRNPIGKKSRVVGASGFEPPTSWSRTRRDNQASLRPDGPRKQKRRCLRRL